MSLLKKISFLFWKKKSRRTKLWWEIKKERKKPLFFHQNQNIFKKRKKNIVFKWKQNNHFHSIKKNLKLYLLGFILFTLCTIWFIVIGPYTRVENIKILKKDNLTNIDIAYKSINPIRWKSIFRVNKEDIKKRLLSYQHNIKNIEIKATLPNNLKITLESYKQAFYTTFNGKGYIITENGTLIPSKDSNSTKSLIVRNHLQNNTNKFVDYKQIYSPENIKKIQKLVTKLEENIVNLKIKNIVYYVIEREVHIENESNILLFSLEDDINTQIEKTAIFHKQHFSLNTNGLYYIDMRVPNKIFYCTRKEQNTCEKHLKRIYES